MSARWSEPAPFSREAANRFAGLQRNIKELEQRVARAEEDSKLVIDTLLRIGLRPAKEETPREFADRVLEEVWGTLEGLMLRQNEGLAS